MNLFPPPPTFLKKIALSRLNKESLNQTKCLYFAIAYISREWFRIHIGFTDFYWWYFLALFLWKLRMMIWNHGFQEKDALVHRKMWGEKSHGKYLKRQFRIKRNIYTDQNDEGSHMASRMPGVLWEPHYISETCGGHNWWWHLRCLHLLLAVTHF